MIADYKEPETNKIVRLENKGMAPANMFAVVLKDDCGKSDAKDVAKLVNGKVVGEIELNNLYQIEFDGKSKEDLYAAIEKAKTSDKVLFAFPDAVLRFDGPENSSCNSFDDPFYEGDNGKPYEMINLKKAWDIIKATGVKLNDVTVGVVDTDINYDSDELKSGKSLIVPVLRKDMNEKNELTHGTMVTEIIAANNDNGGMSGVASVLGDKLTVNTTTSGDCNWKQINNKNVNPDDLSEFNASEVGYQSATFAVEAMKNIQKQIDYGATIINCSFGNHKDDYTTAQHQYFSKIYRNFLVKVIIL
ncbi:MAG: S8 family serine peptidase [Ignavibacteriae bacterium]|nr:S8 family serine peptidase [Ignavibacteriota bacterium]